MPRISFIIPCYYNEGNIPVTAKALIENEQRFPKDVTFEYVMIDDGSKDKTYAELVKFYQDYPEKVKVVKLVSNVGSHRAILAGLHYATGDCNVILAADLQDPPDLIPKMYDYWSNGLNLVIANRKDREESIAQKMFSNTYHFLIRKLALPNIPTGGYDLILFDNKIREEIVRIKEKNTNIVYLISWLGYDYVNIPYVRKAREIGKSRWTAKGKIKLFIDSFVSFSFFPIRLISIIGLSFGLLSIIYLIIILVDYSINHNDVEGWSSLMIIQLLVGSFQMIGIGILGEYLWRILDETRKRPDYVVEEVLEEETTV